MNTSIGHKSNIWSSSSSKTDFAETQNFVFHFHTSPESSRSRVPNLNRSFVFLWSPVNHNFLWPVVPRQTRFLGVHIRQVWILKQCAAFAWNTKLWLFEAHVLWKNANTSTGQARLFELPLIEGDSSWADKQVCCCRNTLAFPIWQDCGKTYIQLQILAPSAYP